MIAKGFTVDTQALDEFKQIKKDQLSITQPAERRWKAIERLAISYKTTGDHSYKFYCSPAYTFAENNQHVVSLSRYGGFSLVRRSPGDAFTVALAATASELAVVGGTDRIVQLSGLAERGAYPNGGGYSMLWQTD